MKYIKTDAQKNSYKMIKMDFERFGAVLNQTLNVCTSHSTSADFICIRFSAYIAKSKSAS